MTKSKKRIDAAHVRQPNPTLDALGITAIAKSQKPDKQRNLLSPGFYEVALHVDGTIEGERWEREIKGTLTVAPDSAPVASSSTPWDGLLCSAICSMTEKKRQAWLAIVASGYIPDVECGMQKFGTVAAEMEPALSNFRAAHPAAKRGIVSFVPTPPPKS